MHPESSDGFASVGAILPKEKAALLPGGLLAFAGSLNCSFATTLGKPTAQRKCSSARVRDALEWQRQADVAQLVEQLIRNQ